VKDWCKRRVATNDVPAGYRYRYRIVQCGRGLVNGRCPIHGKNVGAMPSSAKGGTQ
jgi:hypothetical protein